jgi:hypothetical protein
MKNEETGRVNVSVANLYREASYQSETVSQALLAEKFIIEARQKNYSKIKQADGYSGWISNYQWVTDRPEDYPVMMVRAHMLKIFHQPDTCSTSLRDATAGVNLPVRQSQNGWLEVVLPDGKLGWAEEKGFGPLLPATRTNAVQLAEEFFGIPYFWGGRSARGFDCSGLVQTVFALMGLHLPRDSWMQQRDGSFVSDDLQKAQAGDLYFFSDNKKSITHVGLAAGNCRIIHARGMVRMNSLRQGDPEFNQDLLHTFIDVRTYF